jgi:hypothetical protein
MSGAWQTFVADAKVVVKKNIEHFQKGVFVGQICSLANIGDRASKDYGGRR